MGGIISFKEIPIIEKTLEKKYRGEIKGCKIGIGIRPNWDNRCIIANGTAIVVTVTNKDYDIGDFIGLHKYPKGKFPEWEWGFLGAKTDIPKTLTLYEICGAIKQLIEICKKSLRFLKEESKHNGK